MHVRPARRRTARPLLAGLALLLLLLAGAEVALRLFTPAERFLDPDTDAYWQARLRARLAAGRPGPADIVYDARLGWRMAPDYHAAGVTHDDRGYRRSTAPAGGGRGGAILALGDSFTYGLGVADGETFASRLAELTGRPVVNAGVTAHGVDQSLLLWEGEGAALRPQTVVFGYAVDKFHVNALSVRDLPKPYFRRDPGDGRFHLRNQPVPTLAEAAARGLLGDDRRPRLPGLLDWARRRVDARLGRLDLDRLNERAALSDYLLTRLHDSVQAHGARLLVAFIGNCDDGPANRWIEEEVMAFCRRQGYDCLDLAAAMRGPERGRYFGANCHYSPAGHRLAAERIAAALR